MAGVWGWGVEEEVATVMGSRLVVGTSRYCYLNADGEMPKGWCGFTANVLELDERSEDATRILEEVLPAQCALELRSEKGAMREFCVAGVDWSRSS